MIRSHRSLRAPLLGLALVALIGVVTIPALAANPSAGPATGNPGKGAEVSEAPEASEAPEVTVTVAGVVGTTKDADGTTSYSLAAGGKTLKLDAGPSWFFGANHPLAPFVGKNVTIVGEQSGDQIDVETVDGVRLRAEGKPPWAGGWKAVGSAHPGWSQDKADRWAKKQATKGAAGAAKDHGPEESGEPSETPEPSGG